MVIFMLQVEIHLLWNSSFGRQQKFCGCSCA